MFFTRKKKVCHLTSVHSSHDIRIFHKQCKSLLNVGYDISFIVQNKQNELVEGVKIVGITAVNNRLLRMILLPLKIFVIAVKQRADIYHFHDPELIFVGVLLKIFTKGKVIYDVHEDYCKQILYKAYIPEYMRKIVALIVNQMEKLTSRYFDGIVTATDNILKKFSFHKHAISVRNFPIISNFENMKRNKIKKNENGLQLIYTGGLSPERGITQIVQSLELLKHSDEIRLNLCGRFYPKGYEEKVKKLKGFEKVVYHGWVELPKIVELLEKIDVGIVCFLPEDNHINAMPNKLFEYMAAGIPTIASDFPGWKKIVKDNKCGICVNPLNPGEIASAINYLHNHPKERIIMGKNGKSAVRQKYSWTHESKKLINMYKNILP